MDTLVTEGVFLDRNTVDRGDLDTTAIRRALPEWRWFDTGDPTPIPERVAGAQVVVSNKVVLDSGLLARAQGLRLICVAATGTNNVDLAAARAQGIAVSNVRAYATPAVVQHVFSLLLALSTRLLDYHKAVREGAWQQAPFFCLLDFPIRELRGRTLGIVGLGELGRAVAGVAEAFGMEVLVALRPGSPPEPGRVPLDALLPQVDVLSLHCPLTPETRGLIGERELALMKRDAILINTARGGIVDEAALAGALRSGRLGGAGVDVLSVEPPAHGNVLLEPGIPNLLVTPHVAWASRESRQRLLDQVALNIASFVQGTPRNLVG
jgi:glycerate dehydrogenase